MWSYKQYKDYRREQNIIAEKWFKEKVYPVNKKYSFILDKNSDWRKNILLKTVADFIEVTKRTYEKEGKPFPSHKYIHHGLSSQAMLFNLLGEVVLNKDYTFLSTVFNFPEVQITPISELLFEYSCRKTFNENQQQPTSFDFAIINKTGKNVFLEAKYVETEFGKCSTIETGECDGLNPIPDNNYCYLTYKGRNYWELMKKYKLDKPFINSPICPFAVYYQFYRELMFALENNGYYVILIDNRNPAFNKTAAGEIDRGLIPVLTNILPEELKPYVKIIYIQDVINKLRLAGYTWASEFKNKYGML